jgi:ATP-dependent helicase HrpA
MQVETRGAPEDTPSPFKLEYDPALPITAHRKEVIEAVQRNPVIVLCGATGSGKSTQLPKLCLEAGRGVGGVIGHTQPRRIAARALASRLAEETGTTVGGGGAIGYKVRFTDRTGPNVRVKLMTDGILLKELETDRKLRRYDTLIIDEAHERSLNIDLLLGVLKQLLPQRPDLRLIVTSATIDPGRFATFFGGAPVIEVSGRSYPVEVRYRPLITSRDSESSAFGEDEEAAASTVAAADAEDTAELTLPEGIIEAVRELDSPGRAGAFGQGSRGDVLVFLPGEKHIREATDALEKARLPNTEIVPLFARLSSSDQERIFQRHSQRRVVLSTNVAETSLTVPGIRFVIDSGLARISRYSVRSKVQRLPIERISRASADQRKGRCGREAEGICIRLYSEEDFTQREEFTPPEVLRTNLASVILRMATLGLGDPETFPFLDPPDTRLVNDGVRLLQELKAMDDERRVTSLGQQIAGIPVDPRLGRMLLAASRHHCLTEMLVVASFLEGQDPRERPTDAQQQASEKHALFADPRSDFVTVLNVWRAFNEQVAALSRNQLRKWCREHFLSFLRMREWQDLHTQLSQSVAELKLRSNQMAASYTDLHQAILTGFLGSIGELDEKREYNGPRGLRFVVAPGTPLASKPPRWIVAGSLVETTRLYARMVAAVDPGWIEAAGAHLLKRSYSEPTWVAARGFVSAFESVALYGLTLAARRRVNYGAIAPREARDIFIHEALVETSVGDGVASGADDYAAAAGGSRDGGLVDVVHEGRAAMAERGRGRGRFRGNADDRGGADRSGGLAAVSARGAHRSRVMVEGDFLAANRRLRAEIEAFEAKIRRRDVVVDEERQQEFYAARIPERVNSVAAFNHWRIDAERANSRLLYMSRSDLMQREVPEAGTELFPDEFPVGGNQLPLLYRFDPAEPGDGVTLIVPEPLLDVVNAEQIAWLVPGMRLEKITAVFRALPKAQRKLLVPVPDFAKNALDDLGHEAARLGRLPGFHEWLAQWVTQHVGSPVSAADLAALPLPDHLRMNLRVLDADDRVLAESRDLLAIKRKLYATTQALHTAAPGGEADFGVGSHGAGYGPGAATSGGANYAHGATTHGAAGHAADAGANPRDARGGRAADGSRREAGRVVSTAAAARDVNDGRAGAESRGSAAHSGASSAGARGTSLSDLASLIAAAGGGDRGGGADHAGEAGGNARAGASGRPGGDVRADARRDGGAQRNDRAGAGDARGARAMVGGQVSDAGRSGAGTHASVDVRARADARGGDAARGGGNVRAGSAGGHGVRTGGATGAGVSGAGARAGGAAGTSPAAVQAAAAPVLHRQWDFGDLPETREVERNRLRLVVYPAIEDRGTGVALIEARNASVAEAFSRAGMVRLAMLALPQQAKYVSKRMTDDRDLVLLSRGLPFQQSLSDALTQRAFRECLFPADTPLPRDAQAFGKILDDRRAQLNEIAERLAVTVVSTLKEWRAARVALDGLRTGAYPDAVADMEAQLALLLPPDFIESTARPWLDYLPRYIKAVTRRVEKLAPNARRDAELAAKVKPFFTALRSLMAEPAINGPRPDLDQLRWMVEEYRVSLFAQDLKTMLRVSDKRLAEQLALARDAQR